MFYTCFEYHFNKLKISIHLKLKLEKNRLSSFEIILKICPIQDKKSAK
jgi:hypothetical protein